MGKAYETARTGGKHHGWYRISQDLGDRQIEKSIRSFQEQVRRHQAWIADAYAKLPRNASAAQVSRLVTSGWPEDIERHLEFIDILKGILKERSKMTPSKQQVVIEELLTAAIDAGMKALEPYLNDPNCLTTKRQEISRRLKGMETLVPGTKAPDISMKDLEDQLFELYNYKTLSQYTLLIFWSGDCSHCVETTGQVYPWQQQVEFAQKISVIAISLDETETEVAAWEKKWKDYPAWKHLRAIDGIRSKAASDYYVLARDHIFFY